MGMTFFYKQLQNVASVLKALSKKNMKNVSNFMLILLGAARLGNKPIRAHISKGTKIAFSLLPSNGFLNKRGGS